MEAVTAWLEQANVSETMMIIVVLGTAACLLVYGISTLVSGSTDPVRKRLVAATAVESAPTRTPLDLGKLVEPVARYVLPQKTEEQASTRLSLVQAGFRAPEALRNFYALKALLALALPLIVLGGARWLPQLEMSTIFFLVALAAFIGVSGPNYVLAKLRNARIKRLKNGLPDALDLLVVCVESGLGLAPALERVSRELEVSQPELAQELALVNAEMRAGVERPVALRNLATRTGVEDIGGLVAVLVQTIRFGTSVADALRVYSEEFRDKRMQKAEEQAAKIGTKLIFPLVLCFFPAFFLVAIGPAVMRLVEAFKQM